MLEKLLLVMEVIVLHWRREDMSKYVNIILAKTDILNSRRDVTPLKVL